MLVGHFLRCVLVHNARNVLDKCLFESFAYFLIGLFMFSLSNYKSSLWTLDTGRLSDTRFTNIVSHSVGRLVPFLVTVS